MSADHVVDVVEETASGVVKDVEGSQSSEDSQGKLVSQTATQVPSLYTGKTWIQRNRSKLGIASIFLLIVIVIAAVPKDILDFGRQESTQTFTFASIYSTKEINLNRFLEDAASATGVSQKCLTGASTKADVPFNRSTIITEISFTYKCKTYNSNEFRDRMQSKLANGVLASYGIVGFGEGLQTPKDFCGPNNYGLKCQSCKGCTDSLVCDAGTLGSGACKCSSDFVNPIPGYSGGKLAQAGRCLMLSSAKPFNFGMVNVGTTLMKTLFVFNIGNQTTSVRSIYLEAVPSEDGSKAMDVQSFEIISQPTLPMTLAPGRSFSVTIKFKPLEWGKFDAYLGLYINDNDNTPPDDAVQAVEVSGLGSIGNIVPEEDELKGDYSIYTIDSGSEVGSQFEGKDWVADNYFTSGSSFLSSGDVLSSYRSFGTDIASVNGYRLPIPYSGSLLITLYFKDAESTAPGQRTFDVYINNKVVSSMLDIFALSVGGVYKLQYSLPSVPANELIIDLRANTGNPIVSAVEVVQSLSVKRQSKGATNKDMNYAKALHMNYLFYEAQKSGSFSNKPSRLPWRSDSCLDCNGSYGDDLSKGYYEAGNYMKLNFPMCWTITSLAWGMIETQTGHAKAQQIDTLKDTLKWATDYLIESHPEPNVFALSVGWANSDFMYSGPPEKYRMYVNRRDVFYITSDPNQRSSETLGECAAALAASSMVFKNSDPEYANELLTHSKQIFQTSIDYPGSHMDSTHPGFRQLAKLYASWSFEDEMAWGASWLYAATNDLKYLDLSRSYYDSYISSAQCGWAYSWEEKGPGLSILLSKLDRSDPARLTLYDGYAKCHLDMWLPGASRTVPHTPRGLAFRLNWGACRFAANIAFLSFSYLESLKERNIQPQYQALLYEYGKAQVDYMLGIYGRSYLAGYGAIYPKYIWHKSSYNSILYWPVEGTSAEFQNNEFKSSVRPQTHILYGALVGGPIAVKGEATDFFLDNRSSYVYTEVTIDYNAALSGALAYLVEKEGGTPIQDSDLTLS